MVRTAAMAVLCLLSSACATNRIAAPANSIAESVSRFRTELSNFQQTVKFLQKGQEDRIAYLDMQRQDAAETTMYQQRLWAVANAATASKMFDALRDQPAFTMTFEQAQADNASTAASTPSLPLDKLATVVQDLQGLSQSRGLLSNIKFMAGYAQGVKSDLGAAAKASPGP